MVWRSQFNKHFTTIQITDCHHLTVQLPKQFGITWKCIQGTINNVIIATGMEDRVHSEIKWDLRSYTDICANKVSGSTLISAPKQWAMHVSYTIVLLSAFWPSPQLLTRSVFLKYSSLPNSQCKNPESSMVNYVAYSHNLALGSLYNFMCMTIG